MDLPLGEDDGEPLAGHAENPCRALEAHQVRPAAGQPADAVAEVVGIAQAVDRPFRLRLFRGVGSAVDQRPHRFRLQPARLGDRRDDLTVEAVEDAVERAGGGRGVWLSV